MVADEPDKRRLTGKTDTKNDNVLILLEIEDSQFVKHGERTPQRRAWCGDESWQTKILQSLSFQRSEKGTTEGAELADRNGCRGNCEAIISSW